MVKFYSGTLEVAWDVMRRDVDANQWRVLSVSWTGGGFAASVERTPKLEGLGVWAPAWLFIGGAVVLAYAGFTMIGLRSIGGDSVAEFFYHAVGWASFGLSAVSAALGVREGSKPV